MKEVLNQEGENKIEDLKMLFQVDFIAKAIFQLTCPNSPYSSLLVINHNDKFLSLSNGDLYILLLPDQKLNYLQQAEEQLNYIQNRRKLLVILQLQSKTLEEERTTINIDQIVSQAVSNGIPQRNLFLKLLKDISHG